MAAITAFNPNGPSDDGASSPPHNVELEQQVLGAVLSNNDLLMKAQSVTPEHFYDPVHAAIWKNITARIARDHVATAVTVKSDLEHNTGLAELGGTQYLARLVGASVGASFIADYARELVEIADRRVMLETLQDVQERVRSGLPGSDARSELELFIHQSEAVSATPRSMSLLAAHTKSINDINERYQSGEVGLSTGLTDLDDLTGGLHPGELTLVAGSTSMGKTAMGIWLAYHAASRRAPTMVGFASLEMSEVALSQRFASIDSEIPYQALRKTISEATFRAVVEGVKKQDALPIHIYSDRVRDIPSILSESRRLQKLHPPSDLGFKGFGLLVIDYIQLVRGKGFNTAERLGQVAMDAKQVAKALSVPVVALAQVDRGLAKRDSPVPFLADLRGSGDLEFAADNVIFTHRPEYYLERDLLQNPSMPVDERADVEAALAACKGTMDLYVAKQRMGPIGKCRVRVDMGLNTFSDINQQEGFEV